MCYPGQGMCQKKKMYAQNEWMTRAQLKISLRYCTQSEEDYVRTVSMGRSWNRKALERLQIGT